MPELDDLIGIWTLARFSLVVVLFSWIFMESPLYVEVFLLNIYLFVSALGLQSKIFFQNFEGFSLMQLWNCCYRPILSPIDF